MTAEILLKTINQGARSGIPVVIRTTKLTLKHTSCDLVQPASNQDIDACGMTDSSVENTHAAPQSADVAIARDTVGEISAITMNACDVTETDAVLDAYLKLIQRLQGIPPETINLTTREAAIFLRRSKKSLEAWRLERRPPDCKKCRGKILYNLKVLIDFVNGDTR